MKTALFLLFSLTLPLFAAETSATTRNADTVILNETGVKNLRIETVMVEEADFEESVFALGRIDVYAGHRAVISSRIAGRALEVFVKNDHPIAKGAVALIVESRQPGNPPPRVEITAPISGLVSATHIAPGEPVEPDKALAEILDLSEVYALARVPEHLAGQLKPGLAARITVPATGNQVFEADLEHLGATADADTGTVEAAFHVKNPELTLRPGMRAEFSITLKKRAGVTSVPRSALQGDAANRFVYVKDFDLPNAFIKTPVVVGEINDRSVEIISGLLPADEVVTHGAYSLAFAGAGSISLKEALDAAHGHEHAEDGSELSDAKKSDTPKTAGQPGQSPFWMITSLLLFVAWLVTIFRRKGSGHA